MNLLYILIISADSEGNRKGNVRNASLNLGKDLRKILFHLLPLFGANAEHKDDDVAQVDIMRIGIKLQNLPYGNIKDFRTHFLQHLTCVVAEVPFEALLNVVDIHFQHDSAVMKVPAEDFRTIMDFGFALNIMNQNVLNEESLIPLRNLSVGDDGLLSQDDICGCIFQCNLKARILFLHQ